MRFRLPVGISLVLFLFYSFLAQQPVGARSQAESDKARNDVYFSDLPITADTVLHEAIHSLTGFVDRIRSTPRICDGNEWEGMRNPEWILGGCNF